MAQEPDINWQYAIDAIQLFMDENPDSINVSFDSIIIKDIGSNKLSISIEYKKEYDQGELEYSHNTRAKNE